MPGRETGTLNCSCDLRFEEYSSNDSVDAAVVDLLWDCPGFLVAQEAGQEPLAIVEIGAAPSRKQYSRLGALGPLHGTPFTPPAGLRRD